MNKNRRKQIDRVITHLEDALEELESIKSDEEEYHDNMPEGLRDSDKGYAADEAISNLDSAIENVQQAIDDAGSAKDQ
ncbi:hypothetical protein FACS1894109_11090 [Spirochaetia bacterium]|nr:hypothetical protein FACS1894109_11090 [Spirochaetia bacterium]